MVRRGKRDVDCGRPYGTHTVFKMQYFSVNTGGVYGQHCARKVKILFDKNNYLAAFQITAVLTIIL